MRIVEVGQERGRCEYSCSDASRNFELNSVEKNTLSFVSWHKAMIHGDKKQCNRFPVKSDQIPLKCRAHAVQASVCDGHF